MPVLDRGIGGALSSACGCFVAFPERSGNNPHVPLRKTNPEIVEKQRRMQSVLRGSVGGEVSRTEERFGKNSFVYCFGLLQPRLSTSARR